MKLMEIIDEISNVIPEQHYIDLCNSLKYLKDHESAELKDIVVMHPIVGVPEGTVSDLICRYFEYERENMVMLETSTIMRNKCLEQMHARRNTELCLELSTLRADALEEELNHLTAKLYNLEDILATPRVERAATAELMKISVVKKKHHEVMRQLKKNVSMVMPKYFDNRSSSILRFLLPCE